MMRYFLGVFFLVWLMPHSMQAQGKQGQARLDSMVAALAGRPEDTAYVNALCDIAREYHQVSLAQNEAYAAKALALAEKLHFTRGQARAHNLIGDATYNYSRFADALPHYMEALRLYEVLGDQSEIAATLNNLSEVYNASGNLQKAYAYASLGVSKLLRYGGPNASLVYGYMDKASAALLLGKKAEAYACYLKMDSVARQGGDPHEESPAAYNLGNYYLNQKELALALASYFRCLRILETHHLYQFQCLLTCRIGLVYKEISEMAQLPLPDSLIPAGREANRDKALGYLTRGLEINRIRPLQPIKLREMLTQYGALLMIKGQYQQAAEAYRQASQLGDTVAKAANGERVARMESEQAMKIKDKDIQIANLDLSRKKNQSWILMGGVGLMALVLGLVYRGLRQQKRSNTLLAKEKRHTEAEKKRSDDLLLNILPEEVANELKEKGTSKARHFDEVSVLFTDFVNFTEASEQLSPTELVTELHTCFSAFDNIIGRHGLEKIKTIGDAYMAVSGLPIADINHAGKCVSAALEIRDYIAQRSQEGGRFQIRIGINSGPVVAGIVGIKKFAYDIWGDTVNTAARMEQHGEAGQVNISASTYLLVRNDFVCNPRGKISAKHKGEIEMYFVQTKVSTLATHA